MSAPSSPRDLVVLTADKNCQFAVRALLSRSQSLGIRPIIPDFYIHPGKDPGALRLGHEFLRTFCRTHAHALVVLDREGCGQEALPREQLESFIEEALARSGWSERARAVVIDPELEAWVWSNSPCVDRELHWEQRQPNLRAWLRDQGLLGRDAVKPARPKEALEAALREVRMPRSSAIYEALAKKVSVQRCEDPAFGKLKAVIQGWFAESPSR